jgi:biopolymer transport protein ExbD
MQFRGQRSGSQLPEVNVIPMLTVMMGTVGYFVIVTMTLTAQQAVDIPLPGPAASSSPPASPEPLVVTINAQGQLVMNDQPIDPVPMQEQVRAYLNQNPKASVLLKADDRVRYEQVVQVLGQMRTVGGDQVSLTLE